MTTASVAPTRRSSRHMPKVQHERPDLVVGLIFGVLICGVTYALWKAPWFSTAVFAALVITGLAHTRKARRTLSALAAQRKGESICTFARSFDTRAVDTWVVRAVYEQIQAELDYLVPNFPLRASDDLSDLLLDPDELDMSLAPDIAQRTGRCLDDTSTNPYLGKVRSVSDLVGFFNAQARVNAA